MNLRSTAYASRWPGRRKIRPKPAPVETLKFTYPDFRHDAETLMVHPQTGDIYVVTKRISGAAGVYKFEPDFTSGAVQQAKKIADISVPAIPNGFITGGDISPDGNGSCYAIILRPMNWCCPMDADGFDDIWGEKPVMIELGEREQGEAISYSADGKSIFATSEKKNSPIIEVKKETCSAGDSPAVVWATRPHINASRKYYHSVDRRLQPSCTFVVSFRNIWFRTTSDATLTTLIHTKRALLIDRFLVKAHPRLFQDLSRGPFS